MSQYHIVEKQHFPFNSQEAAEARAVEMVKDNLAMNGTSDKLFVVKVVSHVEVPRIEPAPLPDPTLISHD